MGEPLDPQTSAEFDAYAHTYEELHAKHVARSGEGTEYFAAYKRDVLARLLGRDLQRPILDYGCGIGNLTRLLVGTFGEVHGYDPSSKCARLAEQRAPRARFFDDAAAIPRAHYDAVILANVMHHVPPDARARLMSEVTALVHPGGAVVLFEHNPLNPLTRKVVRDCPFDENAVLLYPWQSERLLRDAGLRPVSLNYIVFFPRPLARMRRLEPLLRWLPLGAQTVAWGRRG